jgi:1,4-alpha-glucan branching enzyme
VSLPADAIRALVTGKHGDPFSVLGPHAEADGALAVRVCLPDARAVAVSNGQPHSVTLSLPPLGALLFRWTGP